MSFPSSAFYHPCSYKKRINKFSYYMAGSMSGQDEPNCVLRLATQVGKMELSCPLGTIRRAPQQKFPQKTYNNPLLTKLVWSRWLDIGLILFFARL